MFLYYIYYSEWKYQYSSKLKLMVNDLSVHRFYIPLLNRLQYSLANITL